MSLNNIPEYSPTQYIDNSEPDINAANLNKTEQALKRVTAAANEAIAALQKLDSAKIDTSKIVNSLAATDTSSVLSGALGPVIDQRLTDLLNKYNQLNGELDGFRSYSFNDTTSTDDNIRPTVEWYINNGIDSKKHSFIITLELIKGSTFSVLGMTASTPSYCAVQVFSYSLPAPLYGVRKNNVWTWK